MHNFKELSSIDLKLLLLGGQGIKVDNLQLTPYTLAQVRDFGYTKYMQNLQWVLPSVEDFIASTTDIEKKMILMSERNSLKSFDFFSKLGGAELTQVMLMSMAMIFQNKDIRYLEDQGIVVFDFFKLGIFYRDEDGHFQINSEKLDSIPEEEFKVIHRDNFDEIIEVVKLQNGLTKVKVEEENPVDEETRALMEQMKKNREKVNQMKQNGQDDGEGIDLADIISAVSSKSNTINKFNIWDLTLYQLYDEYARLELIDNYDFSVKAIMAGAEKVDLKHWSSKL
ncbi:hypothetical protein PQE74_gp193 [Bacillus phage vB_BanS_Chewbecca]|uniref:Uncharacterized protein n=4 Tax=Caudoviricetes TaxID=2731619 RepID=A0AAE8YUU8_9CAUD|nr:hypothetical protein PQE72_gp220 [Bacillus phage vB_BanS_Skywalker]YP_010681099.1 hypothetical protein PQE73_gp203 [Bacillus phage vB_BanS_MrDarsey]YP_010681336.1 hypothetical protein PQE74_gp193 [Bacillus phage vB_BanS_Chewbecca]UGO46276.1 hypothetical protein CHEWBECCA_193 [Bacillus phage vB_BanS_Chewbecca]UGO48035.1 hypothetical protein MRDARSEY_203 [Bacillus phage vB_BanS_MrDarsey]UGO51223.1 hypothetical protein SKYWALKER_66 [Bacillus phage vB_BanS_Skywalker]